MHKNGQWKTALIDIDRATEFVGDDVDRYSKLVDLGEAYDKLIIALPTLTSAAITVYVQEDEAVATVPKVVHYFKPDSAATAAWATTAGTGDIVVVCLYLGGHRWVRLNAGANQAADRSIRICGTK